MQLRVLEEHGYEQALTGLSLSFGKDPSQMGSVAQRLCFLGNGHNKFLETIVLWLDLSAPRYFWQQFDTYRVGVTKQSESTMHTMVARPLAQRDFEHPIPESYLQHLNQLISEEDWERVKHDLPESFVQRRIVCLNYMALQRIVRQRGKHRLSEWQTFIRDVLAQVKHPELLKGDVRG